MPAKAIDVHPTSVEIHFLPVEMRVPLKFGAETLTHVQCVRVQMVVDETRYDDFVTETVVDIVITCFQPGPQRLERADCDDAAVADGDGFRTRQRIVHRNDGFGREYGDFAGGDRARRHQRAA